MKKTQPIILLLTAAGFLTGSLFAEGERGEREKRGHKGPKSHGMLMSLDQDKDGQVSKVEFLNHFDKVDANGDGLLSKEELKAHHESRREEMKKKMESFKDMSPEERFAHMDKDGNGTIEKSEFHRKEMFDRIDIDSSGSITQDELKAAKAKMGDRGGPRGGKRGKKTEEEA